MKETIKDIFIGIFVIAVLITVPLSMFTECRNKRQYDQGISHIPPASRAIASGNYHQALAELKEIDRPEYVLTAAMAYCIYKTEGKSAAIRTIMDFLAKNNVNENDRQFLMTLIDKISSDNISTFILDYTTHKDSRGEQIEFEVKYR